ncbi:hypothetical protein AFB00_15850 [Pseudonocardia sp. HH130630-07]|nr:hypothetical protein AFB00_15850 [Pseudonocardia sp. HH130630-07]
MQIDQDNVLGVRHALQFQADQMQVALFDARKAVDQPPCGADPVSIEAAQAFDEKILQIIAVHEAHRLEIVGAVDRLRDAALEYGYTDQDIENSFARELPGIQQRHADALAARAASA